MTRPRLVAGGLLHTPAQAQAASTDGVRAPADDPRAARSVLRTSIAVGEAAASGAYGEQVTDPDQVGSAIQRGLKAVSEGTPAVLDMWLPKLVTGAL